MTSIESSINYNSTISISDASVEEHHPYNGFEGTARMKDMAQEMSYSALKAWGKLECTKATDGLSKYDKMIADLKRQHDAQQVMGYVNMGTAGAGALGAAANL